MAENSEIKVGLLSCSGEEIPEGTLSRAAVRIVLESLRPKNTVTLCLPLFVAGDGGERGFAKKFSTIAVDGCGKLCAKKATEKFSGKVDDYIDIEKILEEMGEKAPASRRNFTDEDWKLAQQVAEVIAKRVDIVMENAKNRNAGVQSEEINVPLCSCMTSGPKPHILTVGGKRAEITGLDKIIALVSSKKDLTDRQRAEQLLAQVTIYNGPMDGFETEALNKALFEEYVKQTR